jgi:dTDP-glucose 4,6-dehydratase
LKKLLVTGGAGFIGSEFVRQGVKRGYEIVVVDKPLMLGSEEDKRGGKGNNFLPG